MQSDLESLLKVRIRCGKLLRLELLLERTDHLESVWTQSERFLGIMIFVLLLDIFTTQIQRRKPTISSRLFSKKNDSQPPKRLAT